MYRDPHQLTEARTRQTRARARDALYVISVAARLVEAMFIAIGIVGALTFIFLRQAAAAVADPGLELVFAAVYDRAFLIGPGIFAGVANGMILGYLMYRSGLVPPGLAVVGLIGGPLVALSSVAVIFDVIPRGGTVQGLATIPEFVWELSFGVYLIVKGFRLSAT